MEDERIVELFWARDESAIQQTAAKYGGYVRTIAKNILRSDEDSEECVNDAFLSVWNAIPPERPRSLQAFLGKITRNIALDRYRANNAEKRGGGNAALAIEELRELTDSSQLENSAIDRIVLKKALEDFLKGLSDEERRIFLKRYWYFMSVKEIASEMSLGESKVKMVLLRCRGALRQKLQKEGFDI